MKSDIMYIDGNPDSTEKALDYIEKLAGFFGFDNKDAAFARLLAEEGISAFSSIIGINKGSLWVETKDKDFEIHLKGNAALKHEERDNIISLSKNKKNTPKKGIIGKIANLIDFIASDAIAGEDPFMIYNMYPEVGSYYMDMVCPDMVSWSMMEQQKNENKEKKEEDELAGIERSIIEKFADDIIVTIVLKNIELIIKKTLK